MPGRDCELRAIGASGDDHVRKQQVDRLITLQYLQRLRGVNGGHDLVTELPQTFSCAASTSSSSSTTRIVSRPLADCSDAVSTLVLRRIGQSDDCGR